MNKRIYGNLLMFISGLCAGLALLWGFFLGQDQADTAPPESVEGMEPERAEIPEPAYVETVVDYPFFSAEEGWSLVLRESRETEDAGLCAEREFCLYDESGQILQTFSCDIEAEDLIFRFDVLFDYYDDLIVFPAAAQEVGTDGVCYQWERKKQRFVEAPVIIPWYQEGSVRNKAFLVPGGQERVQTNTICRINGASRSVVELRRWTLCKDEETGERAGKCRLSG